MGEPWFDSFRVGDSMHTHTVRLFTCSRNLNAAKS